MTLPAALFNPPIAAEAIPPLPATSSRAAPARDISGFPSRMREYASDAEDPNVFRDPAALAKNSPILAVAALPISVFNAICATFAATSASANIFTGSGSAENPSASNPTPLPRTRSASAAPPAMLATAGMIAPNASTAPLPNCTSCSSIASKVARNPSSMVFCSRSHTPGSPWVCAAATSAACPWRVTASLSFSNPSDPCCAAIPAKRIASDPKRVAVAA